MNGYSFFEISGILVECHIHSIPSPTTIAAAVEAPERGATSTKTESVRSAANETGEKLLMPYRPLGSTPRGWVVGQGLLRGFQILSSWTNSEQNPNETDMYGVLPAA